MSIVYKIYKKLFSFIFALLISSSLYPVCQDAEDYGIISMGQEFSGEFNADFNDYWIKFTTSCDFKEVVISTCGSSIAEDGDPYLDTVLEAYPEFSSDGNEYICGEGVYQYFDITNENQTFPNWYNDDVPIYCSDNSGANCVEMNDPCNNGQGTCISQCNTGDGSQYHAILAIPNSDEQENGILLSAGTYYVRISPHPTNFEGGEWNLSIMGSPVINPVITMDSTNVVLIHNPFDGAPGGEYEINLDASQTVCTEQVESYEWFDDDVLMYTTSDTISTTTLSYDDGIDNISLEAISYSGERFASDVITLQVTEPNTAPIANATILDSISSTQDYEVFVSHDGDLGSNTITVELSAYLSEDFDNDILDYTWNQINGDIDVTLSPPSGNAANPSFSTYIPFDGESKEFSFELTAVDPYGLEDKDSIFVTVSSELNNPPIAIADDLFINIFHDGDTLTHDSEVFTLDGSASYDFDNEDQLSYRWIDNDDLEEIGNVSIIDHEIPDASIGEYFYKLRVTDPYNETSETIVTVTVGEELNEPPVVQFTEDIIEFTITSDGNPGGLQTIVLEEYTYNCFDPDDDDMVFTWYDENDVELIVDIITLDVAEISETYYTLRATDSYGAHSYGTLYILLREENDVPIVFTSEIQYEYEPEDDILNCDEILFLYGNVYDDQFDEQLGFKWELLTEDAPIEMLDDSSKVGSFRTNPINHNDNFLDLEFSFTVWDPFSCYRLNDDVFEDQNENGIWDSEEEYTDINFSGDYDLGEDFIDENNDGVWNPSENWLPICSNGEDSETFGMAYLNVIVDNYNSPPLINTDLLPNYPFATLQNQYGAFEDEVYDFNLNWESLSEFSSFCDTGNQTGCACDNDDCAFQDLDDCELDSYNACEGYAQSDFSVYVIDDCSELSISECDIFNYCSVIFTEEDFVDENSDGIWNNGEPFIDCNEDLSICEGNPSWDSSMGNGEWDQGENYTDSDCNGEYNLPEPFTDCYELPYEGQTICSGSAGWDELSMGNGVFDRDWCANNSSNRYFSSENNTDIVFETNYNSQSGNEILIPFRVNDNNQINNLSDLLLLSIYVQPVNDIPELVSLSEQGQELISAGSNEETAFSLSIEDFLYYDVEGDMNGDGVCNIDHQNGNYECDEISLIILDSANSNYDVSVSEGVVIPIKDFYGDLEVDFQLFDGYDYSAINTVLIPIHNINDIPIITICPDCDSISIEEALQEVFNEQGFPDYSLNLNSIFSDVDLDILSFELILPSDENVFFDPYIDGSTFNLSSINYPDLNSDEYGGIFSYTIHVFDESPTPSEFQITLSVNPINDPPVANPMINDISCPMEGLIDIEFGGSDVDSDSIGFVFTRFPSNGFLYTGQEVHDIDEQQDCIGPNYIWSNDTCIDGMELFSSDILIPSLSDSVSCVSALNAWVDDQCVNPYQLSNTSLFSSAILYAPASGFRCRDTLSFSAYDFNQLNEFDLFSNSEDIVILVGECNQPPIIDFIGSNFNIQEDSNIIFYSSDEFGADSTGYYNLNDPQNFHITDLDSVAVSDLEYIYDIDSVYLEIWEGPVINSVDTLFSYYIESGLCAYQISESDWNIDPESSCGLMYDESQCPDGQIQIPTNFEDGSFYCSCGINSESTCIASQDLEDSPIVVRPAQDFDDILEIMVRANDGNPSYNLGLLNTIEIFVEPIDDAPRIGEIPNQQIDEGETLTLNYSFSREFNFIDSTSTFSIYDPDINLEEFINYPSILSFNADLGGTFEYSVDSDNQEISIYSFNNDWNGDRQINLSIEDSTGLESSTSEGSFFLIVNPIDDEPDFGALLAEDVENNQLIAFEDSTLSLHEFRIYFEDPDFDLENQTELEEVYMDWVVSPVSSTNKVVLASSEEIIDGEIVQVQGVDVDSQDNFYYYKKVYVSSIVENFNGPYQAKVSNETLDTEYFLDIFVQQQNDLPDSFPANTKPIIDLNLNDYDWPSDDIIVCTDEQLAQGIYDITLGTCSISNIFIDNYYYKTGDDSHHYTSEFECLSSISNEETSVDSCIAAKDLYHRLPFSRTPSIEEISPDGLFLSWNQTNDADIYSSEDGIDLELFYRIELLDESNNRVIVLKDEILGSDYCNNGECQYNVDLDNLFFSYNMDLNYYDSCGIFDSELSLSDTSSVYLDLTGNTKYSWQVAANNNWCDYNGNDPSQIFSSTLPDDTSFYIDLIAPKGTITVMQNDFTPDFLDIYITFDEEINSFSSELFITYNDVTTSSAFIGDSGSNIYHLTELIPGEGVITIDVESWDLVGNGILNSKEIVYQQILSSQYNEVISSSGGMKLKFEENDIDRNGSILVQEDIYNISSELISSDNHSGFYQVSGVYKISSVDIDILEEVTVEINIPQDYLDLDYWKFKIFSIDDNNIPKDITSWNKDGIVIGSLTDIKDIALYYDPQAELEIPDDISLLGNYPNPFNPSTIIHYLVKQNTSSVRISILDLLGREVRVLYEGVDDIGYHELSWDGNGASGVPMGSGIYFISANINNGQKYKKIMKLK